MPKKICYNIQIFFVKTNCPELCYVLQLLRLLHCEKRRRRNEVTVELIDMNRKRLTHAAVSDVDKWLSSFLKNPFNKCSSDISTLVDCLELHNHAMLQFKAVSTLTKITSSRSDQTNQVVAAGAVPLLIKLLSSPALKVCEQAVMTLGSIIGKGPELRDLVIQFGIVGPLVSFIKRNITISSLRNITWVIANLCRNKDPPPPFSAILEILGALNVLIQYADTVVLGDTVWAISYLAGGGKDQIQMVIESGVVPKLVPLLSHPNLKMAALRTVGNILTGSYEQIRVVLNCDALSYFPALLHIHANQKMRKLAVSCISNITVSHPLEVLTIIGPFCDLLACQDTKLVRLVLDGLYNMLNVAESNVQDVVNSIKECGGQERIEFLRIHNDAEIYDLANEILEQYFSQ